MEEMLPIRVTIHRLMKAFSIFGVIEFLLFAWLSWQNTHTFYIALLFLLFALFCGYTFIASRSTIELDLESVVVTAPYGRYKIRWDDVRLIETNGVTIVFRGDDKRLVIVMTFVGQGRREMYKFLNSQIEQRQIEVKPLSSIPLTHKNTRVR